ncbi:ribosomal RNA processing protein 36 [Trifolium pratense]|uniref:Ribosomal RNA processing protein 36 n=1 Tax=Trifolium pratense TaxID=57577 RepID=A0A2K3P7E9_TRIPR|nr:ribosomal RNA processing protein 36 [Trifolium pratense]
MAQKHGSRIPGSTETQYEECQTDDESLSASSSSEDEEEEEEEEEEEIEKELADVTFEELQKARSNGEHVFFKKLGEKEKLKRANKNRPMEASSKKPVPTFRDVIQAPKKGTMELVGGEITESSLDFHFPLKQLKEDWKWEQVAAEAESSIDVPLPKVRRYYGRLCLLNHSTLAARDITVRGRSTGQGETFGDTLF